MSEKEIIEICQNLWFDVDYFGIYYNKEENKAELAEQALQGLLDLYNKEKEKNKGFERVIDLKNAEIKDLNQMIDENYISKDKIRELIEKWKL